MKHQPRVDPVVTELIASIKANDDAISSSLMLALAKVVQSASQNLGEKAREACIEIVSDSFKAPHDGEYAMMMTFLFTEYPIIEHYCHAVGLLVVALSDQPELVRNIVTYVKAIHQPW